MGLKSEKKLKYDAHNMILFQIMANLINQRLTRSTRKGGGRTSVKFSLSVPCE